MSVFDLATQFGKSRVTGGGSSLDAVGTVEAAGVPGDVSASLFLGCSTRAIPGLRRTAVHGLAVRGASCVSWSAGPSPAPLRASMTGHGLKLPKSCRLGAQLRCRRVRARMRSGSVLVDADGEADPLGQQVPERDVLDRVVLLLHVLRHLVLHVVVLHVVGLLLVVRVVVRLVPR